MNLFRRSAAVALCAATAMIGADKKGREQEPSPLDEYIKQANERSARAEPASPGSNYSSGAAMLDLAADLRARRIDDLLTVVVLDRASAVSKGTVSSSRSANARASIDALGGRRTGLLPNLASLGGETKMNGQGETSRETVLSTSLTTRVAAVLPNGYVVIEGTKQVRVNSETQLVKIRGVVRPYDISYSNAVFSDQVAQLEISVDGKGVVGDAIRRPHFLYRLLLGLLPF